MIQAEDNVHMQGLLLGGGRKGVQPRKLELNRLMLEQVYYLTRDFIMSFTFIITDGWTGGQGRKRFSRT